MNFNTDIESVIGELESFGTNEFQVLVLTQRFEPMSLVSPALVGGFFTTASPKACSFHVCRYVSISYL